jgi:peptide/nickel transport system substrate-binding protein
MDDTPDKDQNAPSAPNVAGAESSPHETVEVKTSPQSAAPIHDTPPPQTVVSHHGRGKKPWLKIFIIILLLAAIVGGGWYFYSKEQDKNKPAATQSKTIDKLNIGILSPDYGELYPNMSPSAYSVVMNAQVFEGLVRYENRNKIVPNLASTWTNPDDKTWLFTLTPNVKFHDGHTVTPADVKYSLETVIANSPDISELFADSIASVEVVGSNQVKITTKEPDPILLNKLSFLYIIDAKLPSGDEPSMAGTGPYYVKPGTKPSAAHIEMVAFNDYHGGVPKTKALDFGGADDAAGLVKGFKDHKFNIAGPIPVNDAKGDAGAYTFTSSEPGIQYLGFNTVKPGPLQNKQVREAIRYAVNAQAIGKATGNQVTTISQMIPPSIPGYNPSITPYKQNIAKAKELLAKAGYPNGVTIRLSSADDTGLTKELVKNLEEAGITVTVDTHADFDEFIDYFTSGKAEVFQVNYASDTLDGQDIIATTVAAPNYANPKLDELLAQIDAATDPAKRLKLLQQAEELIDEDVAVIPLYSEDEVWLMDKNYALKQDLPSSFISVYFYKVQLK